ncbi:MAG: DNA cytosine methyltransferase [Campylobacterota bacterium]|nr:DNA cytosine methyltransferase [Campylobacterota bacterium]
MKVSAVDLFCGIGGLSYGFKKSGINVKAGIDFDPSCQYAYESNCDSKFIHADISHIQKEDIVQYFNEDEVKVLVGCAPCQPFSTYTLKGDKHKDQRWQLLYEFTRLIKETQPEIVSMENVPNLLNFKKEAVFETFVSDLKKEGYHVWYDIVYSPNYGIPQKRKRLVLLASKKGKIQLIPPTHKPEKYITVKDAIGDLEKIEAGKSSAKDFIHKASKLSEKNLKRLRQSTQGGSWRDWDENLKLECHKKESGKTYGSVYGRMKWDEPSPTMTTFCVGIGNGRFGHPEQDRAISLREAGILQSFPVDYKFASNANTLKLRQVAKQIGNAVPPKLGEVIGLSIIKHLQGFENKKN